MSTLSSGPNKHWIFWHNTTAQTSLIRNLWWFTSKQEVCEEFM